MDSLVGAPGEEIGSLLRGASRFCVLDGGVVQVKRSVAFKILEARIYVRPLEKDDAASLKSDGPLSKGV
jgi:hypothetical protein